MRSLGRVTLFPSAFGAGDDAQHCHTRPCALVESNGTSLVDIHTGQRFPGVSEFVEAACMDYVRQLNGMQGSGIIANAAEAGLRHARKAAELDAEAGDSEDH